MTKSVHIYKMECDVFLYMKDYLLRGKDRFFIYADGALSEHSAAAVAAWERPLVTHDYGLIARSLFAAAGRLPCRVVDVVEFHRSSVGVSLPLSKSRDAAFQLLADAGLSSSALANYSEVFFGRTPFDSDFYLQVALGLLKVLEGLEIRASLLNEMARFCELEIVVFNILWLHAVKGIRIDPERLRVHKDSIENEFFSALKLFSVKHNLAFEIPSDGSVKSRLDGLGLDVENTSIDYLLSFVQLPNDFGTELLALRKLGKSRLLLSQLPVSRNRTYPLLTISGTVTSRIFMTSPSIQNLARRHRDIICADSGKSLNYVDYAQFEVGVMVALAGDPVMREMYLTGDLYSEVAKKIFGDRSKRKISKRLFLSYSYGMTFKALIDASTEAGADRSAARTLFRSFDVFEKWKLSVKADFASEGRVSSFFGNNLLRKDSGPLTAKEGRSAVSQVVQGTASLIFKRALVEVSNLAGVDILVLMHDAVLVQSSLPDVSQKIKCIFEECFNRQFDGKATAIAEVSSYQ